MICHYFFHLKLQSEKVCVIDYSICPNLKVIEVHKCFFRILHTHVKYRNDLLESINFIFGIQKVLKVMTNIEHLLLKKFHLTSRSSLLIQKSR